MGKNENMCSVLEGKQNMLSFDVLSLLFGTVSLTPSAFFSTLFCVVFFIFHIFMIVFSLHMAQILSFVRPHEMHFLPPFYNHFCFSLHYFICFQILFCFPYSFSLHFSHCFYSPCLLCNIILLLLLHYYTYYVHSFVSRILKFIYIYIHNMNDNNKFPDCYGFEL